MVIERHNTAEEFCGNVTARKAAKLYLPASKTGSTASGVGLGAGIGDECIRLLVLVATPLPRPLTWVYEQLRVTRTKGGRLVRQLVNAGLVCEHIFATGKQGGSLKILEVTNAGWDKLSELRMEQPKALTHGGWEHNLVAAALELIGRGSKRKVSFEVVVSDVRVDVCWQNPTGQIIFFQIGTSNPDREAANFLKASQTTVVQSNRLILVCRDKKFGERVKKLLKAEGHAGLAKGKLELRLAGEILQCVYDKQGALL